MPTLYSKFGICTIDTYWHICHILCKRQFMATIYEKLGDNVRRYRKKKNLSQEELAMKAKLDLTSVSEIESGLRNPSLKTLHKLALALDIKTDELLKF